MSGKDFLLDQTLLRRPLGCAYPYERTEDNRVAGLILFPLSLRRSPPFLFYFSPLKVKFCVAGITAGRLPTPGHLVLIPGGMKRVHSISVNQCPLVVGIFGTGFREIRVNLPESVVETPGPVGAGALPRDWTKLTPRLAPADFSTRSAAPRENPVSALGILPAETTKLLNPIAARSGTCPRRRCRSPAYCRPLLVPVWKHPVRKHSFRRRPSRHGADVG